MYDVTYSGDTKAYSAILTTGTEILKHLKSNEALEDFRNYIKGIDRFKLPNGFSKEEYEINHRLKGVIECAESGNVKGIQKRCKKLASMLNKVGKKLPEEINTSLQTSEIPYEID